MRSIRCSASIRVADTSIDSDRAGHHQTGASPPVDLADQKARHVAFGENTERDAIGNGHDVIVVAVEHEGNGRRQRGVGRQQRRRRVHQRRQLPVVIDSPAPELRPEIGFADDTEHLARSPVTTRCLTAFASRSSQAERRSRFAGAVTPGCACAR